MRLLKGAIRLELIPLTLAMDLLYTLGGFISVGFGIYALVWGGRGQRGGGLGPIPETRHSRHSGPKIARG
jgi:hypothetical protein